MNDENYLSQKILSKLNEFCNYDEITDRIMREKQVNDIKITNIDIQYLLKNENIKDMMNFLVNKVKSAAELEKTRDRIRVYSLYKEKIDKINLLEKRKQELMLNLNSKKSELLNSKEKLSESLNSNLNLKKQTEENKRKIDVLNSKNQILKFSQIKSENLIKEFEDSINKLQSFKMETTSSLMSGKENLKEFLASNSEFVEKKINKELTTLICCLFNSANER